MDSAKNLRWIIPFMKFGMVRVKGVTLYSCIVFHLQKTISTGEGEKGLSASLFIYT